MTPRGVRALISGAALVLAALPALAAEVVTVSGRLTDADFYRLVSCAAPPGGDCSQAPLRWRADRPIRVALRRIDPAYLGRRKPRAEAAVTRALQELNAAGADFRLARVSAAAPAEIAIYFLDLKAGETIAGTGLDWVDGAEIAETAARLAVDPGGDLIRGAAIVVSTSLETSAYEAAMLTALTGAMGLTTAIEADAYAGVSVLAQASHETTRLGPQDIAALRTHYATPLR